MRQLQIQLPEAHASTVLELAVGYGAASPVTLRIESMRAADARDRVLMLVTLPNRCTGEFVEVVRRQVDDVHVVLLPIGALPLHTPLDHPDARLQDVSALSTLELVLSSLQSVGSWKGILIYSVLAGVVGAYGVVFDVSYLLVAAMLINPMGAPALVSVTGLAIGDPRMFARGGLRFLVSLGVQAGAALLLGIGYALDVSTEMMEQVTGLSAWAAVVALAAGAAGAQTQVKSDRDSLVSGTAAGFMVAAALAPPAAVLGLSVPLARWDYTELMAFLLILQFVAIGVGGWAALQVFGVRPADPSIGRGTRGWRTALVVLVVLVTVGLVWWQTQQAPRFVKADLSREALHLTRDAVAGLEGVALVESAARFTRPDLERHDAEGLLIEVRVEQLAAADEAEALEAAVRSGVEEAIRRRMARVVPFVDVTVLPPARAR